MPRPPWWYESLLPPFALDLLFALRVDLLPGYAVTNQRVEMGVMTSGSPGEGPGFGVCSRQRKENLFTKGDPQVDSLCS